MVGGLLRSGARRRTITAVTIGAVAALTACSSPAPSGPSGESSATAVPAAAETPKSKPKPAGTVIKTSKGSYLQAPMPPVKYKPAIVEAEVKQFYSDAEIASAVKFISGFMVHHGIGSPVNGGDQTVNEWLAAHGDLIAPEFLDEFTSGLADEGGVLIQEKWQQKKYGNTYQCIYDADRPRVQNLKITPKRISAPTEASIAWRPTSATG